MEQYELNDMREQLEILKQKITREEQLGEKQIRRAMRKRMARINRRASIMTAIGLLAIPYMFFATEFLHLSNNFCWVTCLLLFISVLFTIFSHSELSADDMTQEHLITVARKLMTLKRRYRQWLYFSIPILILWCWWFFFEIKSSMPEEILLPCFVGGVVGLIAGGFIGFREHKLLQDSCSEMLEQIEDITKES